MWVHWKRFRDIASKMEREYVTDWTCKRKSMPDDSPTRHRERVCIFLRRNMRTLSRCLVLRSTWSISGLITCCGGDVLLGMDVHVHCSTCQVATWLLYVLLISLVTSSQNMQQTRESPQFSASFEYPRAFSIVTRIGFGTSALAPIQSIFSFDPRLVSL